MPLRKRDYKSEYARRKALAESAGYTGVRQYKRARRQLNVPRRAMPVPRRIAYAVGFYDLGDKSRRREAAEWSREHSRSVRSQFDPSWDAEKVDRYWNAFPKQDADPSGWSKERDLRNWLVPEYVTEDEWETDYASNIFAT